MGQKSELRARALCICQQLVFDTEQRQLDGEWIVADVWALTSAGVGCARPTPPFYSWISLGRKKFINFIAILKEPALDVIKSLLFFYFLFH